MDGVQVDDWMMLRLTDMRTALHKGLAVEPIVNHDSVAQLHGRSPRSTAPRRHDNKTVSASKQSSQLHPAWQWKWIHPLQLGPWRALKTAARALHLLSRSAYGDIEEMQRGSAVVAILWNFGTVVRTISDS